MFKFQYWDIVFSEGKHNFTSVCLRGNLKEWKRMKIISGKNTLRKDEVCRGVVDGTSRHILIAVWGSKPRICPHYVWSLAVLFKLQFHEHHKNSLKIEKNTLKLKSTLLCLAFHGLECHLLPPANKANINTLPCLLFFMHSIFFTWQSGHLKGNYSGDLCPCKENCLYNI